MCKPKTGQSGAGGRRSRGAANRAKAVRAVAVLCLAVALCLGLGILAHATVFTSRASIAYLVAHTIGGFESFTPPAEPTFADVLTDHPVYAEIEYAASCGIMAGYPDSTFQPDLQVNRAQGAVYVAREHAGGDEYVPPGPATPTFVDVPVDHWAYKYVEYDVAQGIFTGYPDGTFRPTDNLDLYEAAIWFYNATGVYVDPSAIPPGMGTVGGTVSDAATLLPIAGAWVIVCDGYYGYDTTTAWDGTYSIPGVLVGPSYTVCAMADGYYANPIEGVSVTPGDTTTVNLALTTAAPPPPAYDSHTMYCPDWYIELNDAGYADWMIMQYPHQVEHENLSGEWAAAILYDGNSMYDDSAMWLTPWFICPNFSTNSTFVTTAPMQAWDDPGNPTVGHDAGYAEIANAQLKIAISYTMYMLETGSAAGLRPGGEGSLGPTTTGRYVLGQTYEITNISDQPVTNLKFFQMLHAHPNDDYGPNNFGVYDPTPYPLGGMPEYRYDITEYGGSLWNPPGSDITGFSAAEEPTAWGIGEFPGHEGEPLFGLHRDIYSDTLPMTVLGGPAEIAGAMKWDLGTLDPGATALRKVILWNGYCVPQLPPVGRVLSMPTNQPGVPGVTVEIPVNIGDASGVTGVQVRVTFDPGLLEPLAGAKGHLIAEDPHWQLPDPMISEGSIELLAYHDQALGLPEGSGSDSLLLLTFLVRPDAPIGSTAWLHFDTAVVSDPFGDPLPYTSIDGSIKISTLKPNHLYIYAIESPQVGDPLHPMPFLVTVEARDLVGNVLLGYATSLNMYDATGTLAPVVGQMEDGCWSGQMTIGIPTPVDFLIAVDGSYPDIWAESNEFQVIGLGDVNADDEVNVLDVVKIVNFALGRLIPSPGWQAWVADINQSSTIDVLDVLLAVNLALGQPIYSESFAPLSASAAPPEDNTKVKPVKVSLSTDETKDGLVIAAITVDNAVGVAGIQVDLNYDPSSLSPVSSQLGDLTSAAGAWTLAGYAANGTLRVVAYSTNLHSVQGGRGSVAAVTFARTTNKGKPSRPSLAAAVLGNAQGGAIACEIK